MSVKHEYKSLANGVDSVSETPIRDFGRCIFNLIFIRSDNVGM